MNNQITDTLTDQTISDINNNQDQKTNSFFCGQVKLYSEISRLNYVCSLCHYFVMTFIFVSVESLQPLLFQSKFNIHPKDAGMENGYILLVDIATKCVFAPFMGILSDKYGRVPILQIGIVLTGASLCLMSQTNNLYPQYCLARILYAIGAITLATIPFLADYVQDSTKGRAAAINVVLAACGAVFSATVITNLLIQNFQIEIAYLVVGSTFVFLGLFYTLGLKRGLHFKIDRKLNKIAPPLEGEQLVPSICPYKNYQQIKEIYKDDIDYINYEEEVATLQALKADSTWRSALKIAILAGKNIWIFQGYVTNFLGRGDSILLTLSLQIWSQQFVSNELDQDEAYKQASIKAQTLSGVTYTVIMVFAIIYGILFERISKNALLITMFGLTMIGCFLMNFAPDPSSGVTFGIMAILGTGMSGLYTGALYFINKYAYTEFRGYISGLANVFSVLGILVCSFLGGLLQDKVNKVAPFNLFGIMSFFGLVLVIWSYYSLQNKRKRKNSIQ